MIEILEVTHDYLGSHPTRVVEDISLSVPQGEVLGIVGKSGCGKTTLLKLVAGLLTPTRGRITIGGLSAGAARAQRKFGMVFQDPVLLSWRTVRENIHLPFELCVSKTEARGADPADSKRLTAEALKLVDLEKFGDVYPSELSGGMRARAAIARALSYRPEVLLMDEPFGSLDEITRSRLNGEILALQRKMRITMLVVTHSLSEAAFLSHRVAVLGSRPSRVRAILTVPETTDKLAWRETVGFLAFCRELRASLYEQTGDFE